MTQHNSFKVSGCLLKLTSTGFSIGIENMKPVIYFLFASLVLGSVYQAIAAVVLGVGHITISIHEFHRASVELVNCIQE